MELLNGKHLPFCTTSIGADHDSITPVRNRSFDVTNHQGFRVKIVDGDFEETLNLTCVEIEGDEVIAPGNGEHIGNEFSGDRCAGLVLFVLSCIRITWYDCSNTTGGGGAASRDEDEELHEVVVDIGAAGLENEDVLVANGLLQLNVDFSVGEPLYVAREERDVEPRREKMLSEGKRVK